MHSSDAEDSEHVILTGKSMRPDYAHWGKLPFWTEEEATALSLDLEPAIFLEEKDGFKKHLDDYKKRLNLISRSIEAKSLDQTLSAGQVSRWARKNRLELSQELERVATQAACMDERAWNTWLARDAWSLQELKTIVLGLDPDTGVADHEGLHDAEGRINRAVLMGNLACVDPVDAHDGDKLYGSHRFFEPSAAVNWARSQFEVVDFAVEKFELRLTKKDLDVALMRDSIFLTLAAILKLAQGESDRKSVYSTQEEILADIDTLWPDVRGLGNKSVKRAIAEANKRFKNAV